MSIDVTDATFEADVLDRSAQVPVVVDLWAEWCGPCKTLGPVLERVVDETDGGVVLAKVDTDANPQTAAAFQVQSIPAVYGMVDRKVVGGFVGARGEREVREFVSGLLPSEQDRELDALLAAGDEESLRAATALAPGDERPVLALAELLVERGEATEALGLLESLPASAATRRVAARARHGDLGDPAEIDKRLAALLDQVKVDDGARAEFVELLELFEPDDPRQASWRKQLTTRLF